MWCGISGLYEIEDQPFMISTYVSSAVAECILKDFNTYNVIVNFPEEVHVEVLRQYFMGRKSRF